MTHHTKKESHPSGLVLGTLDWYTLYHSIWANLQLQNCQGQNYNHVIPGIIIDELIKLLVFVNKWQPCREQNGWWQTDARTVTSNALLKKGKETYISIQHCNNNKTAKIWKHALIFPFEKRKCSHTQPPNISILDGLLPVLCARKEATVSQELAF